ncbi:MAG: porin family protein [Variibacter sp.]|nr:porin family protein [Variibacter sp.]
MKKLAYAAASAIAIAAVAPAQAADLSRSYRQAPAYVAPAAPMLWNGFYIGGQIGYQWGGIGQTEFVTATGIGTGINPSWSPGGVVGGLHVGYNYQMGSMVLGVEGDFEGSGVSGTRTLAAPFTSTTFDSRWQSSLRGRVGVAWGQALLYATGGAAFGELRYRYQVGAGPSETFSDTRVGYTVGAGIEYALSPNWSTRLEYRYTDYGSLTNASLVAAPGFSYTNRADFHTLRAGVTWRFGGFDGPVTARY